MFLCRLFLLLCASSLQKINYFISVCIVFGKYVVVISVVYYINSTLLSDINVRNILRLGI
jgi:hypothetical protein